MAKPSRSRQPDFDPRELEDLILTPAVGTGVGSHLIRPASPLKSLPDNTAPVLQGGETPSTAPKSLERRSPTMVNLDVTTVATCSQAIPSETDPRLSHPFTGDRPNLSTVVTSDLRRAVSKELEVWVTDSGDVVPRARVRRIRLAQDVLNSAEESVYDILWNSRPAERVDGDQYRVVQAGYDHLMKRSRLSKKTIQRIIDRLIEKDFIAIERPAEIYHRTSTVYRVFSYRTVLDRHAAKDRLYAVKIGPGFLFARRLGSAEPTATSSVTTVVRPNVTTVATAATPTVVKDNPTTVVPRTTPCVEQSCVEQFGREAPSSSSAVDRLRCLLEPVIGLVDDDGLRKLLQQCRKRAPDCTPDEIAYFVGEKLKAVRTIQNPMGFMLAAVPRHFEGGGHQRAKQAVLQMNEQRRKEWREMWEFWSRIAGDPQAPDDERSQAQSILQTLGPCPDDC